MFSCILALGIRNLFFIVLPQPTIFQLLSDTPPSRSNLYPVIFIISQAIDLIRLVSDSQYYGSCLFSVCIQFKIFCFLLPARGFLLLGSFGCFVGSAFGSGVLLFASPFGSEGFCCIPTTLQAFPKVA